MLEMLSTLAVVMVKLHVYVHLSKLTESFKQMDFIMYVQFSSVQSLSRVQLFATP